MGITLWSQECNVDGNSTNLSRCLSGMCVSFQLTINDRNRGTDKSG